MACGLAGLWSCAAVLHEISDSPKEVPAKNQLKRLNNKINNSDKHKKGNMTIRGITTGNHDGRFGWDDECECHNPHI